MRDFVRVLLRWDAMGVGEGRGFCDGFGWGFDGVLRGMVVIGVLLRWDA
jgi:hypothetical protein